MKLTEAEKSKAIDLNKEMQDIFHQQQKDPSSFDNHVHCLRRLQKVNKEWIDLKDPYRQSRSIHAKKLLHVKWNVIKKRKVRNKLDQCKKRLAELREIFFDDELNELMVQTFEGKPVSGIMASIEPIPHVNRTQVNTLFEPLHRETYIIRFQDKSEVKWFSLDDNPQMDEARRFFEEKIPQPQKTLPLEIESEGSDSHSDEEQYQETEVSESQEDDSDEYAYGCSMM